MKNGLAIWHYGHRTPVENAEFFIRQGFDSVSMLGMHMIEVCRNEAQAIALGELVQSSGVVLTVHYKLPSSPEENDVSEFKEAIDLFGAWQKRYGGITNLSFDATEHARVDGIAPYIEYTIENVPDCMVAVEDFGVTERELAETLYLVDKTDRFGYLLDLGHMLVRLKGDYVGKSKSFSNSPILECEASENPDRNSFLKAFLSKKAPIVEMHLHNNDGLHDLHNFLDDGVMNVDEVAAAVHAFGFEGVMTIESAPGYTFKCYGKDADDGILATFDLWKRAYAKAENENWSKK